MITIKNTYAQERMAVAGSLLAELFEILRDWIEPGMTTLKVDSFIAEYLKKHKMISCTKGYMGYRHSSCISLNDEVVHGVPSETKLGKNDLVKIDICASYDGYCADMARPFYLGTPPKDVAHLLATAQQALDEGITCARPGERLGTLSSTIQYIVEQQGYGVVREFAGHGIGKKMHEDPEILNYGKAGCGPVIKPGMAFAIEPMITMGDHRIYILDDGWTVKTIDKSLAAHVEDTVIVTDNGPKIITRK